MGNKIDKIFKDYHLNGIGQGGLTSAQAKEQLLLLVNKEVVRGQIEMWERVYGQEFGEFNLDTDIMKSREYYRLAELRLLSEEKVNE